MLMAPIKMTFSCYTISFRSAKTTVDMKVYKLIPVSKINVNLQNFEGTCEQLVMSNGTHAVLGPTFCLQIEDYYCILLFYSVPLAASCAEACPNNTCSGWKIIRGRYLQLSNC